MVPNRVRWKERVGVAILVAPVAVPAVALTFLLHAWWPVLLLVALGILVLR